jgi:hypothetical protein
VGLDLRATASSLRSAIDASEKPEIKTHTLNVSHYDAKLQEAIVGGRITAVTAAEKARLSEVDNGYRELVKLIPEAVKMAEENNDKEAIASARMWTIKLSFSRHVFAGTLVFW